MLGITFEERDWPRARAELEQATAAAPGNDVLFYNLGLIYRRNGLPRRSLAAFERATAAAPSNDVLFYNLGLIYRRNGLTRRSLAAFERSAEINPRHIPSGNPVRATGRVAEVRPDVARLDALEAGLRRSAGLEDDGGAAYHRAMAELLAARGEPLAAAGHRLLALEAVRR